jgi:hypothetical protein
VRLFININHLFLIFFFFSYGISFTLRKLTLCGIIFPFFPFLYFTSYSFTLRKLRYAVLFFLLVYRFTLRKLRGVTFPLVYHFTLMNLLSSSQVRSLTLPNEFVCALAAASAAVFANSRSGYLPHFGSPAHCFTVCVVSADCG